MEKIYEIKKVSTITHKNDPRLRVGIIVHKYNNGMEKIIEKSSTNKQWKIVYSNNNMATYNENNNIYGRNSKLYLRFNRNQILEIKNYELKNDMGWEVENLLQDKFKITVKKLDNKWNVFEIYNKETNNLESTFLIPVNPLK